VEPAELGAGGLAERAQGVDAGRDPAERAQRAEARREDRGDGDPRAGEAGAGEGDRAERGDTGKHEGHAIELREHPADEIGGGDPLPASGRQRGDVAREGSRGRDDGQEEVPAEEQGDREAEEIGEEAGHGAVFCATLPGRARK